MRHVAMLVTSAVSVLAGVAGSATSGAAVQASSPALGFVGATSATWDTVPGVDVLADRTGRAKEPSDEVLYAWRDALAYSQEHGDDVAHPYIDAATGELVLPAKTQAGLNGEKAAVAAGRIRRAPTVHRRVTYSYNELEHVKHDATTLGQLGLPGADAIFATEIEPDKNRVLISADNVTTDLLKALRARYGPGKVAVSKEARQTPQLLASRVADTRPFFGGAAINRPVGWFGGYIACTSGFAYQKASYYYLLTAGHCAPAGGSFQTPAGTPLGTVKSGERENFDKGVGTVRIPGAVLSGPPYTGDRNMLGDLALIPVTKTGMSAARIYTGAATSSTSAIVGGVRPTYKGSTYCYSGRFTYQQCGYVVDRLAMDQQLSSGEWVRNVNRGYDMRGRCPIQGDSGAPIYWRRADGAVDARGILSAGVGGGKDGVADGTSSDACWTWFTDVYRSYDAWGGRVITVTLP